jgi:hypothetical protein
MHGYSPLRLASSFSIQKWIEPRLGGREGWSATEEKRAIAVRRLGASQSFTLVGPACDMLLEKRRKFFDSAVKNATAAADLVKVEIDNWFGQ